MPDPILISSVTNSELRKLTRRLAGYVKSCSIIWLRALGLPVLDGLILDSWSYSAPDRVRTFAKSLAASLLLLRIDHRGQRWTDRRGGYLIELGRTPILWEELSREGFIPM